MTGPLLALRGAVLARLAGDSELAGLMGGAVRVHDEAPRGADPVYAVFDQAIARDASVDLARRHAHEAKIAVWARAGSARTALAAADRIAALLDDAALTLDGHYLVTLRVAALESGRDARTDLARVVVVLAAVTETL